MRRGVHEGGPLKLSGKGGSTPRAPAGRAVDGAHWYTQRGPSDDRIETSGLVDAVVHRIGRNIVSGQLKPGHTLPNESALCEQLGVSRSVLREAVRVLVSKGLLERKSRLGTRVRPPEAWSLLDSDVLDWLSAREPRDRFVRELFGLRRACRAGDRCARRRINERGRSCGARSVPSRHDFGRRRRRPLL